MRKKRSTFIFFIFSAFLALLTAFIPSKLLFFSLYLAFTFVQSFFLTLLSLDFCFLKIVGYFETFLISKILLDMYPFAFTTKLQFYGQILALNLTLAFQQNNKRSNETSVNQMQFEHTFKMLKYFISSLKFLSKNNLS